MSYGTDGECQILVIGKSGNGKSTLCNAMVGDSKFHVGRGMATTTRTAQEETTFRGNRRVKIIDTPDITNCGMDSGAAHEEVSKWRRMTLSHPTIVVLAVRCDVRYTAEEYAIYREIVRLWGDGHLKDSLIVAFTFGDLQDNPLEEELKTVCPELKTVLGDALGTWIRFDKNSQQSRSGALYEVMDAGEKKAQRRRQGDRRRTDFPGSIYPGPTPPVPLIVLGVLILVALVLCIVFGVLGIVAGAVVCGIIAALLLVAAGLYFFKLKKERVLV